MEAMKQILPVWNGPNFQKPRLPKTLSWVIGVEHLSERFADVPQFNNIKVWFEDHPVDRAYTVTMAKVVSGKMPQQVLTVWYSSLREAHWYFMVYPVEAEQRSHVQKLLEEQAFPTVEQWMKAERSQVWLQCDKHLRCIWNRVADRMEMKEEER